MFSWQLPINNTRKSAIGHVKDGICTLLIYCILDFIHALYEHKRKKTIISKNRVDVNTCE